MCSLPLAPPSHLPPCPAPLVVTEPQLEFPESHGRFPLAVRFTHRDVYVSVVLSLCVASSPSCHPAPRPCCCSVTQSCPALCDPMDHSTPGFSVLHYLPDFSQTQSVELMIPSNHLILCFPLLPLIFPRIRIFSND